MRTRIFLAIFLAVLACCTLPGRAATSPPAGKILVAATIVPLGDFCRQIGGNLVQVEVLIPPGASPHVFEPSPSAVAQASKALVFVYIGAGLEPWAEKFLHSRGPAGLTVVEATRGIPLIREVEAHHRGAAPHEEGHAEHRNEAGNPHIWLDPVLAQEICRRIGAAFIQADPDHGRQYQAHLDRYLGELEALHREIQQQARHWRLREFICFHPSFTYFARRYHLREAGVIEAAPGRETTPRHLQKLVETVRRAGIRVVFAEPQLNPRIAEVLAREAGIKVLMLDPMGGRPPYGSDYLKLMRHNLAVWDAALK
jgi:zinc transport system substrate-binding protein